MVLPTNIKKSNLKRVELFKKINKIEEEHDNLLRNAVFHIDRLEELIEKRDFFDEKKLMEIYLKQIKKYTTIINSEIRNARSQCASMIAVTRLMLPYTKDEFKFTTIGKLLFTKRDLFDEVMTISLSSLIEIRNIVSTKDLFASQDLYIVRLNKHLESIDKSFKHSKKILKDIKTTIYEGAKDMDIE